MKPSRRALTALILAAAIAPAAALPATAAEWSAGATAMYGWWKPFLENYLRQLDLKKPVRSTFSMREGSALYGPWVTCVVSDRWGVSGRLLMALHNQFRASSYSAALDLASGLQLAHAWMYHIDKYDADIRAYYTLNTYADLMFGANAAIDRYYGRYGALVTLEPLLPLTFPAGGSLRAGNYDAGPGIGVRLRWEPVKNLALNLNLSLYVMAGTLVRRMSMVKGKENVHLCLKSIDELVLSYYIEAARITISVGGRAHVSAYALITSTPREYFHNYTAYLDQLYGATASVGYRL